MAGQIIIVNGTSGSGKSTACERFVKQSDQFWLSFGIDNFLSATFPSTFGHHGPRAAEGFEAVPVNQEQPDGPLQWRFGKEGVKAFSVMHEWIAAAARENCNIIVDHLLLTDPPVLQDCVERLAGLPVLLVTLKPPYQALMERVANREMGNRFPGSTISPEMDRKIRDRLHRLRPWFYESIYNNTISDLEIDTSQVAPDQVCLAIEERLGTGPGTAFERLRQRG